MIYQVELTNFCNSACPWCVHREMNRPKGYMTRATFETMLQDLPKEGVPSHQLGLHHFGEGLLHPDLPYFLNRLDAAGVHWRMSTNGRLLRLPSVRQMLLPHQNGQLVISMENGAETQDVQALLSEKKLTGSRLQVIVQTLFDRSYELDGDYLPSAQRYISWAKRGDGRKKAQCPFITQDWAVVLWDGRYVSCCSDYDGESVLGRVGAGRERNRPWRACATCDVVELFYSFLSDEGGSVG